MQDPIGWQDAVHLRQIAEELQRRFEGWAWAQTEIIMPILEKAARFTEVADAIDGARK